MRSLEGAWHDYIANGNDAHLTILLHGMNIASPAGKMFGNQKLKMSKKVRNGSKEITHTDEGPD